MKYFWVIREGRQALVADGHPTLFIRLLVDGLQRSSSLIDIKMVLPGDVPPSMVLNVVREFTPGLRPSMLVCGRNNALISQKDDVT